MPCASEIDASMRLKLPPCFINDRMARDLPCGIVDFHGRYAFVEADEETLSDILDDAKHYADMWGPDVPPGFRASAKATVQRLRKAGIR